MVDAAKVADLVLLLVDAQFGKIEMEIFEFTQIVKVSCFGALKLSQPQVISIPSLHRFILAKR